MRKTILFLLMSAVLMSLCACNNPEQKENPESTIPTVFVRQEDAAYTVSAPLQYPDYTFDHTPTTDELRQMAVKAMGDMISVQWSVDRFFLYNKTSTGNQKDYSFIPQNTYCGMPYTNADGTIVQWFEFYDPETGRLQIEGDTQQINQLVGNTCAGCVCAAWTTVCDSIKGACGTAEMVPYYGFIPVGPYESNYSITSYSQYPTDQILRDNGKPVMYESYAQILPADGLVSTPDVHAIMAIEPAYVVRDSDGEIDPDASYVVIRDQRAGGPDGFYNVEENEETFYYSGRMRHEYTFTELYDLGYLPVTTAEFLGREPYAEAEVTFSVDSPTVATLGGGSFLSNYPICVAKMILVDAQGNEEVVERVLLDKRDIASGVARNMPISQFITSVQSKEFKEMLENGKQYTLRYEITVSNAQKFTPVEITVTGE